LANDSSKLEKYVKLKEVSTKLNMPKKGADGCFSLSFFSTALCKIVSFFKGQHSVHHVSVLPPLPHPLPLSPANGLLNAPLNLQFLHRAFTGAVGD
jgi:hypothetical protein